MKFNLSFAVAVLLVALPVVPPAQAAAKCLAGDTGPKCPNCARLGTCAGVAAGGNVKILDACPDTEACTMESGLAVCKPVAQTACTCGGNMKGCDAYDPQRENFCVPDTRPIKGTICQGSQVCSADGCVTPPDDYSNFCSNQTETGLFLPAPECAVGILCVGKVTAYVKKCSEGEYFNIGNGACETFPPDPCAGCAKQMCPIFANCATYAVCIGGKMIDVGTCPTGESFSFVDQGCAATPDLPCNDYVKCNFATIITTAPTPTLTTTMQTTTSTTSPETTTTPPATTTTSPETTTTPPATTTTPSATTPTPPATTTTSTTTTQTTTTTSKPATCTSANAKRRYPDHTSCKKYYECRRFSRHTYRYVALTCPGPFVFNARTRFCDFPANVPRCTV